jgi:hypothetical protein
MSLARALRLGGLCLVLVVPASCGLKGEPVAPEPQAAANRPTGTVEGSLQP